MILKNVLSLFDGMSCGQIALNRLGFTYDNYYASEIDKYAIQITQKNYPNTIQLGSVTEVFAKDLPKIDLLLGGSPCQGFSFAGKQLNFDDPRSKLFFEYVRLLKECKPKYFLLENVKMKKEYQDVITEHLGVEPIEINSSLLSAQNRKRLYWTNIPNVTQPGDKGMLLKDILITGVVDEDKSATIKSQYYKSSRANFERSGTFHATGVQDAQGNYLECDGEYTSKLLTDKDSECKQVGLAHINGHDFLKRVYSSEGKSPTLTAVCGGNQERKVAVDKRRWRKLHPIECERLQTVPDNYTEFGLDNNGDVVKISNTQRYKMLGNGWTVDVIAHIFSTMFTKQEPTGLEEFIEF